MYQRRGGLDSKLTRSARGKRKLPSAPSALLLALCLLSGCAEEADDELPPDVELRDAGLTAPDDKSLDGGEAANDAEPQRADASEDASGLDAGSQSTDAGDAASDDAEPNDGGNDGGNDGSPRDAGSDASRPDAGSLDAGSLDAGSDAGVDAGPRDAGAKDAASPYDAAFVEAGSPGATTFTRVYAILGSRCRSCHTPGAEYDLNWTTKQRAYETLVRGAPGYQTSTYPVCATGGHKRVVPYQPEASLLYTKLARTQPCGSPMPLTTAFEAELLPEIRSWIMDGALNN